MNLFLVTKSPIHVIDFEIRRQYLFQKRNHQIKQGRYLIHVIVNIILENGIVIYRRKAE